MQSKELKLVVKFELAINLDNEWALKMSDKRHPTTQGTKSSPEVLCADLLKFHEDVDRIEMYLLLMV